MSFTNSMVDSVTGSAEAKDQLQGQQPIGDHDQQDHVKDDQYEDEERKHSDRDETMKSAGLDHNGEFDTNQRPLEELDEENCEEIENLIRKLIKMEKEKLEAQHMKNQVDLKDEDDALDYYNKLYSEVFEGSNGGEAIDSNTVNKVTPVTRRLEGYRCLEEARARGKDVKSEDFRMIAQEASIFDEEGCSYDDDKKFFFRDEQGQMKVDDFDMMIRMAVFSALKYRGSFRSMIMSDYYIDESQASAFHYKASHKVPFYFTYYACTGVSDELMAKYLENPVNPLMFASYKQFIKDDSGNDTPLDDYVKAKNGTDLPNAELMTKVASDARIERSIHLKFAYPKFKKQAPNLVCIGDGCSGKSSFLNDVFGLHFEVVNKDAAGLFHDGIDAVFHSKDVPLGFNVFDVQGLFAAQDIDFLDQLLNMLPNTFLLIQAKTKGYVQTLLELSKATRDRYASRTQVIVKAEEKKEANGVINALKKVFDFTVDDERVFNTKGPELMNFGAKQPGQADYLSACKSLYDTLNERVTRLKGEFKDERTALAAELGTGYSYDGLYGYYWLVEDSLLRMQSGKKVSVSVLDRGFRKTHFDCKKWLSQHNYQNDATKASLSRDQVFPMYMKELRIKEIDKQLRNRETLADDYAEQLRNEKEKLEQVNTKHGKLFSMFKKAFLTGSSAEVTDLLELIEAHYLPQVTTSQDEIKDLKKEIADITQKTDALEDQGVPRSNLTPEQKKQHKQYNIKRDEILKNVNRINKTIEDKVLDSELFLREMKQITLAGSNVQAKNQFHQVLTRRFEAGFALEIIDGDADQIEQESLNGVFEWIFKLKENKKKLLVITILGPQSSGKSTLLNYLMGSKFHVSAGRCTKGLNAMLIRTNFEETREILILDSEGIFSIERNDPMYDRRLAIFCMAVSNVLMINIKGELNVEIEKVLQVAIYALQKIVKANVGLQRVRLQFILRDQMETSTDAMDKAYTTLKNSLNEAARAAGAVLAELIEIPADAEQIITMFPNALSLEQINSNKHFTHTVSADPFRQNCSKLRLRLIEIAKKLPVQSRVYNLCEWGNNAIGVWMTVQEKDDLLMIKDLQAINSHREMVIALDEFRKIMSKPKQVECDNEPSVNPLLKTGDIPETMKGDKLIKPDQTIFAQFDREIDKALEESLGISHAKLEEHQKNQKKIFENLKDEYSKKYTEQTKVLTAKMGPEIQDQANRTIKTVVEQIYNKAMTKWHDRLASATIEHDIDVMKRELTEDIINAKEENRNFTDSELKEKSQHHMDMARERIKEKFFKNEYEMRLQATTEFVDIVNIANKAEESKDEGRDSSVSFNLLNSGSTVLGKEINPTVFEKKTDDNLWFDLVIDDYAEPIDNKLTDAIEAAVNNDNDTEIKKLLGEQREKQEEILNNGGTSRMNSYLPSFMSTAKKFDKKRAEQELNLLNQNIALTRIRRKRERKEEETKELKNTIEKHCYGFRRQCLAIIDEIDEFNKRQTASVGLPEPIVNKFVNLINEQAKEQIEYREKQANTDEESHVKYLVNYKTPKWNDAYNQILYNQLLKTVMNNEESLFKEVDKKLDHGVTEAKAYHAKINKSMKNDEDAAKEFIELIYSTLVDAVGNALTLDFETKMNSFDSRDLSKEQILKEAMDEFRTTTDTDTIIMHMKAPRDLEKRIFKRKYDEELKKQRNEIKTKYQNTIKILKNNADEVVTDIFNSFKVVKQAVVQKEGEAGENKQPAKGAKELLSYLYGVLIKELSANLLTDLADDNAEGELERIHAVKLPAKSVKSMLNIADSEKAKTYGYTQAKKTADLGDIGRIASSVTTIRVFLNHIKFQKPQAAGGTLDPLEEIQKKAQDTFDKALDTKAAKQPGFDAAQVVAIGCTGECFFCGARCTNPHQCQPGDLHKTSWHRPMAFKGAYEKDQGQKKLLQDFCTSDHNLNKSRWPKTTGNQPLAALLERMSAQNNLEVKGMNLYLEWDTGSDLDIQVKCGCGNWHGYGTDGQGGSGGSCYCNTCEMARDHDMRCGPDKERPIDTPPNDKENPPRAFEHVYFKNPEKLFANREEVEIGMASYLYQQKSNKPRNNFRMAFFNRWGYQLFPNPGSSELKHEASWMFNTTVSYTTSERKLFKLTKADLNAGMEVTSNSFTQHAQEVAKKHQQTNAIQWQFSEAEANLARNDPTCQNYRKAWNLQWQRVKDIMCSPQHYNCKVLDKVHQV